MMAGNRQRGTGATADQATPARSPEVPSPLPPGYEPSHVIQMLVSMQKDIGTLCAKTDRVIQDVAKLDDHVDSLRSKFVRAEGVGVAVVVLLTLFGGLLWWLIGGELNQIRDRMYVPAQAVTSHQQTSPSPPTTSP